METRDGVHHITDASSGLRIAASPADEHSPLPAGTPFPAWKDARRFCGPLPFTFSHDARRNRVLIIEGVREQWKPVPVQVHDCHIPRLSSLGFSEAQLASAFMVRDIPYQWRKGRYEQLAAS